MPLTADKFDFLKVTDDSMLPTWAKRERLVAFFHETMEPWHDQPKDISGGLDYAFSKDSGRGGFVMLAGEQGKLVGALLMLNTGMGGFVPENLLLFVSIDPSMRGKGVGTQLIERSLAECKGAIKLHVNYDNPAKRLYERLGFENKYAEMRLAR